MSTAATYISDATTDLLTRCRKGEQSAYKEVYDLYCKAMFNVCIRMLNDRDDAADVLQESFIAAFKSMEQFSGKGTFGSWLKRIVINNCISFLRRKNRELVPMETWEQAEIAAEEENESVYSVGMIRAALSKLPDGYRVILTLYLFEEYSHKMIAEKLGISEGTSKSQYSRARRKLMELIKQSGTEEDAG